MDILRPPIYACPLFWRILELDMKGINKGIFETLSSCMVANSER